MLGYSKKYIDDIREECKREYSEMKNNLKDDYKDIKGIKSNVVLLLEQVDILKKTVRSLLNYLDLEVIEKEVIVIPKNRGLNQTTSGSKIDLS